MAPAGGGSPAGKAAGSLTGCPARALPGRVASKETFKTAPVQHELPATRARGALSLRASERLARPSRTCWGHRRGWPVPRAQPLCRARGSGIAYSQRLWGDSGRCRYPKSGRARPGGQEPAGRSAACGEGDSPAPGAASSFLASPPSASAGEMSPSPRLPAIYCVCNDQERDRGGRAGRARRDAWQATLRRNDRPLRAAVSANPSPGSGRQVRLRQRRPRDREGVLHRHPEVGAILPLKDGVWVGGCVSYERAPLPSAKPGTVSRPRRLLTSLAVFQSTSTSTLYHFPVSRRGVGVCVRMS